jgi:hypothetical protein
MQSLRQELLTTNSELERRVDERTSALQNNVEKLQQTLDSTILAMAKIVEIRDPYPPAINTAWPSWHKPSPRP